MAHGTRGGVFVSFCEWCFVSTPCLNHSMPQPRDSLPTSAQTQPVSCTCGAPVRSGAVHQQPPQPTPLPKQLKNIKYHLKTPVKTIKHHSNASCKPSRRLTQKKLPFFTLKNQKKQNKGPHQKKGQKQINNHNFLLDDPTISRPLRRCSSKNCPS